MPHLIWTDSLDTGIDTIDSQHRRIIDYINILHDSRIASDRAVVEHVIDALIDYIIFHFEFEEEMMEESGYEFITSHKMEHECFMRSIDGLQRRFKGGENILDELLDQLTRQNLIHIKHDDAGYVDSVRSRIKSRGQVNSHTDWISNSLGQFFRSE